MEFQAANAAHSFFSISILVFACVSSIVLLLLIAANVGKIAKRAEKENYSFGSTPIQEYLGVEGEKIILSLAVFSIVWLTVIFVGPNFKLTATDIDTSEPPAITEQRIEEAESLEIVPVERRVSSAIERAETGLEEAKDSLRETNESIKDAVDEEIDSSDPPDVY